jgi:U3 small nucleolar RNA-associated protein 19
MRLVKERNSHFDEPELRGYSTSLFKDLVAALIEAPDGQILREEFVDKYVKEYDDIRYTTFAQISYVYFLL